MIRLSSNRWLFIIIASFHFAQRSPQANELPLSSGLSFVARQVAWLYAKPTSDPYLNSIYLKQKEACYEAAGFAPNAKVPTNVSAVFSNMAEPEYDIGKFVQTLLAIFQVYKTPLSIAVFGNIAESE